MAQLTRIWLLAMALITLSACSDIDRNARHQPQMPEHSHQDASDT